MGDEQVITDGSGVAVKRDGTISIKTGTMITLLATLLGTGGGTTLMTMLSQPSEEVIVRLTDIEARQVEQEQLQKATARLTQIIYRSIIRAHPDAAIPLEELNPESP